MRWKGGLRGSFQRYSVPHPQPTLPMRFALLALVLPSLLLAQARPRGRELGVPFSGTPGPLNAITDVPGVAVGHATIIRGEPGPVVRGQGPVRTGVTAILPRPKGDWDFVMAATFNQNGNGDMTGSTG